MISQSLFLAEDAKVILVSRKEELLKVAEEKLKELGKVSFLACDIRDIDQINLLVEKLKRVTAE